MSLRFSCAVMRKGTVVVAKTWEHGAIEIITIQAHERTNAVLWCAIAVWSLTGCLFCWRAGKLQTRADELARQTMVTLARLAFPRHAAVR